jgi:hypothetical protein
MTDLPPWPALSLLTIRQVNFACIGGGALLILMAVGLFANHFRISWLLRISPKFSVIGFWGAFRMPLDVNPRKATQAS